MTLLQGFSYFINFEGTFWNEDHIAATGNTAVNGNPSRVAAHHLDDDYAVVRFSRRVQTVDGFVGNIHCSIEAETKVGASQVVVDGLGNPDYVDAALMQLLGDRLSIVAADGDQSVNLVALQVLHTALE